MAIRSFIAVETPPEVRRQMAIIQGKLKEAGADVRWEPAEKFHATIKFLGNVEEAKLDLILSTIARALQQFHPFDLIYTRLGCFPRLQQPRVIWIGCENRDGTLQRIKDALDDVLFPLGFPKEEREFHPHVTLGRVRSGKNRQFLIPMLESLTFRSAAVTCRAIVFMKSVLKPHGSEYSAIRTFELNGHSL